MSRGSAENISFSAAGCSSVLMPEQLVQYEDSQLPLVVKRGTTSDDITQEGFTEGDAREPDDTSDL